MKAYAYLRVSGRGQVAGDGFPRQLNAIQDYAQHHEIALTGVFREKGVSGTKESMDRPAWRELMAKLHADSVRTIIVEKLDRLARDLMIQESVIADLKKYGFELISVHEPDLMASDPSRKLMRQLLGAIAEYDKSQIVVRLRGARLRKKSQTGRCEGRKPYGYFEGEPQIVQRMRELRSQGLGFDRIAARLNEERVAPRSGARWHGLTVNKILSRESAKPAQSVV
jgi:DNA invertase Pin-like site-specific DNA recombinase